MTDWTLSQCCDGDVIIFLCLYAGYSLITMFFMNTIVVKPMKLVAIFIHEMGHASAAWLTGGSVDKIEVYQNEGGVTNFRGGWKPAIIPAGYVGVSFWGGVFVALSGSKIGATIAAGVFIFALAICLRYVYPYHVAPYLILLHSLLTHLSNNFNVSFKKYVVIYWVVQIFTQFHVGWDMYRFHCYHACGYTSGMVGFRSTPSIRDTFLWCLRWMVWHHGYLG